MDKVILYTHGGGYVSGSIQDHRSIVGKAEKAQAASVDVTLRIEKGMVHCYPLLAPLFPEATEAMDEIKEVRLLTKVGLLRPGILSRYHDFDAARCPLTESPAPRRCEARLTKEKKENGKRVRRPCIQVATGVVLLPSPPISACAEPHRMCIRRIDTHLGADKLGLRPQFPERIIPCPVINQPSSGLARPLGPHFQRIHYHPSPHESPRQS